MCNVVGIQTDNVEPYITYHLITEAYLLHLFFSSYSVGFPAGLGHFSIWEHLELFLKPDFIQ